MLSGGNRGLAGSANESFCQESEARSCGLDAAVDEAGQGEEWGGDVSHCGGNAEENKTHLQHSRHGLGSGISPLPRTK